MKESHRADNVHYINATNRNETQSDSCCCCCCCRCRCGFKPVFGMGCIFITSCHSSLRTLSFFYTSPPSSSSPSSYSCSKWHSSLAPLHLLRRHSPENVIERRLSSSSSSSSSGSFFSASSASTFPACRRLWDLAPLRSLRSGVIRGDAGFTPQN